MNDAAKMLMEERSVSLTGRTLGRYRVLSLLGAGGMGEVYLARDMKLDRKVALKILPPEVAADRSRMNRFVQEAKTASALNHPNIITIHEIDETDSGHFMATEFIDGETLRERMRKAPITVGEASDLAIQIAAALKAAHQAGIIHRDIKPENVMLRNDGLVKVLDFGLAKLTAAGASDPEGVTRIQSETQPGMIMGTVAYMSPEQARGQAVDPRTDIWSLGVVLYEMLSRQPPFRGETASDTLANILHREPDMLNIGALPDNLTKIINRMLAKKLETRYPTMADAVSDLKSLQRRIEFESEVQQTSLRSSVEAQQQVIVAATGSKPVSETSADSATSRADEGFWVAVLPFKYRGLNAELEALAEGLSEDIVTGLSRFSYLRVIARSSTLHYASESGDVRLIGKELGARYVMEGSVRQAGPMLRVAVQVVDATTGAHLWAETYDRAFNPEEIFALQDELVTKIVSTVADHYGVLPQVINDALRGRPADELSAYEALIHAFSYTRNFTPDAHAEIRAIMERAVQKAPNYAECWAMLANMYTDEHKFGFNARPDPLRRALVAARRAVDIAPANAFVQFVMAQTLFFLREFEAFRMAADRAIALNPMDGGVVGYLGNLIAFAGDWEGGCELVERALRMNPHHPGWYWTAFFYKAYLQGDYRGALSIALKIEIPGFFLSYVLLAAVYGQLGETAATEKAVRELLALRPDYGASVREEFSRWYLPELVDKLIDGLRKAGLEIPGKSAVNRPA